MRTVYVYDQPGSPKCVGCGRTHPPGSGPCVEADEVVDLTPAGSPTPLLDALTAALASTGMDPLQARRDLVEAAKL